jgi:hypothetical protein
MRSDWPRSGSTERRRQRWTAASPVRWVTTGVVTSVRPEKAGVSASRKSPRMGVFQSTVNSLAATSRSSR